MTAPVSTPAPAPEAALAVRQLNHAWATRSVLEDIGFTLPAGRAIALVGPSGCGKTTLLHLCAGLLTVQEGQIDNRFARSAMLFQQPHLLPWQTVLGNIALGLKARRTPKAARLAAARRMGHALGLDDIALAQFPGELSGGMQSRAALAPASPPPASSAVPAAPADGCAPLASGSAIAAALPAASARC